MVALHLCLSSRLSASLSSVFLFFSVAICLFFLSAPPPQLVEMQMSARMIGIGIIRIQRLRLGELQLPPLRCLSLTRLVLVAVQEFAFTAG